MAISSYLLYLPPLIFTSILLLVTAQNTCSPTQPCSIGCCTKFGSCGLGPDSCGPQNCISNCDRKSECDPGWGPQWSTAESCPLNVCCSKYGFCGTTTDFCGNASVTPPSCSGTSSSKRTVGYYESWSVGRPCDSVYPEGLPIGAYTHLNFAFAFIDPSTFALAPMDPKDPELYTRFTALKNTNLGQQTWISIGGWSMNDPDQPTAPTFSDLAGSPDAQSKFFASTLSFLETYGFDGVDLDWEYPVAPERSGKPSDFQNYVTFLQNFRNALHASGHNYGLSITIPSSYWYMQHFDIAQIEKTIDWFNLMSYDLHGTWDSTNKFLGPYVAAHTNLTEIDNALSLLWRNGINPGNVVLGLGFYGRSFTLADPACTTAGCVFTSGGDAGQCTQSVGTLSYAEIQRIIASGATVTMDDKAAVKSVVYNTNQWVSYDDAETFGMKVDYANSHCLGGTMVWAASLDDANGSAAAALSKTTRRQAISLSSAITSDPLTSCQLGECGQSCPANLSPAQRSDGKNKGNTGTNTGCSGNDARLYCCPSNDMPTCLWRGTAPFCDGKCNNGEVEVTSSTSGTGATCWTGHKVLCCTKTVSDASLSHCQWTGSAPYCSALFGQAQCPSGQQALTSSSYGAGGEQPCWIGHKSFCCDQPPPYQNCDWYYHGGNFWDAIPFSCKGNCPAGKTVLATDPGGCFSGYGAFCCDNPATLNDPLVEDFTRRIQAFANDPTCSTGQRQYSKRQLETMGTNFSDLVLNILDKRTSLSLTDFTLLLQQISQIVGGQTYQQNLMGDQFNTLYGDRYGLHLPDIAGFYNDWPNMDRLSLSESLMCLGGNASTFLSDYHQAQSEICVNRCTTSRTRRDGLPAMNSVLQLDPVIPVNKSSIHARNIADSEYENDQGPDDEPSWAFMMRAVIGGLMNLEYEQIIRTRSEETILEVVWNLPPGNGWGGINPDFQDHNPPDATSNPDRYLVFHFHTDHIDTSDNLPGIYAVVAFHGQGYGTGPTPRVDGNDREGRQRRARVLQCRSDDYWYPGYHYGDVNSFPQWGRIVAEFGDYLAAEGIITAATFTGPTQGELRLVSNEHNCPYSTFDWGSRIRSIQFGPNGSPPPGHPPSGSSGPNVDDEQDMDGTGI